MLSFRTELENPIVAQDIIELEKKIRLFQEGKIDEEKFRSLRLARGVYGQRQAGVQMVRIKIPYGRLTVQKLLRIADIADEYASGTLHATTRQDIQIHYVSLDKTPELWAKLEQDNITLREACGNTVRNITASDIAGIDPAEPFDVSPYAQAMFEYFLRNPVCQEMGRKFKIAFSSNENDTAFAVIHDLGFIPKIKTINGIKKRGFKVLIGGGLGAQPHLAETAFEFLEEEKIIPFTEAVLRVFDRYGERQRRHKARLKFLLKDIGLQELLSLIESEKKAVKFQTYPIAVNAIKQAEPLPENTVYPFQEEKIQNKTAFQRWKQTNVFEQKQKGFYGVYIKLPLGNLTTEKARNLAQIVQQHAADDIRITINQGYLLKFVRPEALPSLFFALQKLGLAEAGFDSTADITACPGTDTCNLGISSSTGIAQALEKVIREEYPDLIHNQEIKIKISGCPNACGQHSLAAIGFHGSSLKNKGLVLPALQVLLGGSKGFNGQDARVADKVIKIPSKRGTQALRILLDDYENNAWEGEYFVAYYLRLGEKYFYQMLKKLTSLDDLQPEDYLDWGSPEPFEIQKAVGECAGVIIDLVATLLYETDEKLDWAELAFVQKQWADAIYHAYNTFINGAKAYLLKENIQNNSQISILKNFDKHFPNTANFLPEGKNLEATVLQINQYMPEEEFAKYYLQTAKYFVQQLKLQHFNETTYAT